MSQAFSVNAFVVVSEAQGGISYDVRCQPCLDSTAASSASLSPSF